MNRHYLYLVIDVLSIALPLVLSFHPKHPFYAKWKFLWPSILVTAFFFIVWDSWFTRLGVWGFNKTYITGLYFFNLPVEEVLFFICVPYSSVFIYEVVQKIVPSKWIGILKDKKVSAVMLVGFGIVIACSANKAYTVSTFSALFTLVVILLAAKADWIGRFLFGYLFVLLPFFVVNGILTGMGIDQAVVWYNDLENLGLRIGTIPVEDIFYGMLLILMNVSLFEWLQGRALRTRIARN